MSNIKIVEVIPCDQHLTKDKKEALIYDKSSEVLNFKNSDGDIKKIANYNEYPLFTSNGILKTNVARNDGSESVLIEQWGEVDITGNGTFQVPFLEAHKDKCYFLIVTRKSGESITSLKFIANALDKFDVIVEGNVGTVKLVWNSKGI